MNGTTSSVISRRSLTLSAATKKGDGMKVRKNIHKSERKVFFSANYNEFRIIRYIAYSYRGINMAGVYIFLLLYYVFQIIRISQ